jgi:hypothetical protein
MPTQRAAQFPTVTHCEQKLAVPARVVDYREDAEPAAVGEVIREEVLAPLLRDCHARVSSTSASCSSLDFFLGPENAQPLIAKAQVLVGRPSIGAWHVFQHLDHFLAQTEEFAAAFGTGTGNGVCDLFRAERKRARAAAATWQPVRRGVEGCSATRAPRFRVDRRAEVRAVRSRSPACPETAELHPLQPN